jgi:hypothetical protein
MNGLMLRSCLVVPLALGSVLGIVALVPHPAAAQVQQYMLGPGSSVGSETKVEPKNCVTDPVTGAITCDTKLVNPPGDTPAKPIYSPFSN